MEEVSSDECEAKTYARKRYTESQSSIYARSSGKLLMCDEADDEQGQYENMSREEGFPC